MNLICNKFKYKKNWSEILISPTLIGVQFRVTAVLALHVINLLFCKKKFLTQHVQLATRARGTDTPHLLDLVITDTPDIIQDITIHGPLGKSDHAVLKIKCKLDMQTVDNCIGKLNYEKVIMKS